MSFVDGVLQRNGESHLAIKCPYSGRVLAIAGCTNSGKTSIAKVLAEVFEEEEASVKIIHQDEFFYAVEKVDGFVILG
ncbi:unnamed protein product [Strongylus vulgaris]|uniref:Phosphoribulokinase/uridine kinase domain-containing protein n=1 Tax=Strongylus vulgaris TaxID=40348 RepID=A0A3P7IIB4_STRVU|nr:unnamed protein product [Strongylus vulgaris]